MRKDFMTLDVWKSAHLLALEICKLAKKLPDSDEEYGAGFEVCQTAIQIPAGIARACALEEESEFRECLKEARMELRHVDMQLIVMRDLGHLSPAACDRLLEKSEEVRELFDQTIRGKKVSKT